ncbi:DUF1493 family protein [Enterobacter sp. RHBSTW-00994]|nr:DUF1493 family protein [Enterobacter sp. RHBSTW-00994]
MSDWFTHFRLKCSHFDGRNSIESESPFWQKRPSPEPAIKPLIVAIIIESAKVGQCLYG